MEQANEVQEQLRVKSLPRDKFSSSSSSRDMTPDLGKKSHMLEAVLSLLKELDSKELQVVHKMADKRLRSLHKNSTQIKRNDIMEH